MYFKNLGNDYRCKKLYINIYIYKYIIIIILHDKYILINMNTNDK